DSPNSLIVAAGDNVGATPLISAAFQDEPTIEALNHFGLALSSVGNHEFDEGLAELVRLQQGGCHPEKGCFGDTPFAGARFGYLAANVIVDETGQTAFPAYAIRRFGKVPVAFIGMTLEGTPDIVTPAGTAGLSFRDEVDTVNSLVPKLRAQGVEAIVVLVHEGGFATGLYNGCDGISGPIFDIVKGFDRAVDIVISGHTNAAHVCDIDGVLVTSAAHNGRLVTDIDIELDERTHDIAKKTANNLIVTRDVDRDPRLTSLIGKYQALVKDVSRRVVGTIASDIPKKMSESGEMPLGQLIADAQLFAEEDPSAGGAEVAWINPGGVRADLLFSPTRDAAEGPLRPGEVTFGDLFTIQPFGNALVTMTLTGAQIEVVLESQFGTPDAPRDTPKVLQISHTLGYRIDASGPPGDRVRDITIKGRPLEPERA
ncbi:MAG TPA: bifunctional metallophosphatase/5'-nucleotidase, partial [Myxococcota bacterium]|nr:bifunctional metallophosphatase/5'-nucleotidase [Myxococcota bacterium]